MSDQLERSTSKDDVSPSIKGGNGVPSGFVLKLFQMVNGAPNEVISWVPSGDAFRISDLHRLETETLPTFFRHKRFQSLVRQLNFYNFRKVNRERTFWIYRHSLFHRDRPNELCLLRRRTCPGVDGRKHKGDVDSLAFDGSDGSRSPQGLFFDDVNQGYGSDDSEVLSDDQRKQKKRKKKTCDRLLQKKLCEQSRRSDCESHDGSQTTAMNEATHTASGDNNISSFVLYDSILEETEKNADLKRSFSEDAVNDIADAMSALASINSDVGGGKCRVINNALLHSEDFSSQRLGQVRDCGAVDRVSNSGQCSSISAPASEKNLKELEPGGFCYPLLVSSKSFSSCLGHDNNDKTLRSEQIAQSLLIGRVARQLEAHAKRAAAATALCRATARKGGRRRTDTVTPPRDFGTDTMKYNALTYDDEIEGSKTEDINMTEKTCKKGPGGSIIVTDGDESEDDSNVCSNNDATGTDLNQINNANDLSGDLSNGCVNDYGTGNRLFIPPVVDTAMISDVVKRLHSWTDRNDFTSMYAGQFAAAIAGFCMSTAPQDPFLRDKALQLMSVCGPLAKEFRNYRAALFPHSSPLSSISTTRHQNPFVLVKQYFVGESDSKDSVRGFKVFVINCLQDLLCDSKRLNRVNLCKTEVDVLHRCVKTWSNGVLLSPCTEN